MMSDITDKICDRCMYEEAQPIPTSQGIKFNDEIEHLCTSCHEAYKKYMNTGRYGGARRGNEQECGRCGTKENIPAYQNVKTLDTQTIHYLCRECSDKFMQWYHVTPRKKQENDPKYLPPTGQRKFP